jgi:protein TonB
MLSRYASAASSSALVTLALLFMMQFLITIQQQYPVASPIRFSMDWISPPTPDSEVQLDELIPKEKLTKVEDPPARLPYTGNKESIQVPRATPAAPVPGGLQPIMQFTDGPLVVLVRVGPIYPAVALNKGIEGYVVVQFNVAANGLVTDVVVVESSNSVFERAAIRAAQKFKFKPRIVDGVAYESYGIRNLFRFSLNDE